MRSETPEGGAGGRLAVSGRLSHACTTRERGAPFRTFCHHERVVVAAASDGESASRLQKIVGRYALHGPISAGGMASVHFGRLIGPSGFTRAVAIKRLHEELAADPGIAAMLLDEARLASRIHHPNVVAMLDVIESEDELLLVMDYVRGVSVSALVREANLAGQELPAAHAVAIIIGALHGLHAAHEAKSAAGESLAIVHRDISPQNILVGEDGLPRLIDFGIAKAAERLYVTRDNELRGKLLYMAPEQLEKGQVDRRADVYAIAVVLWEMLAGRRFIKLEAGDRNPAALVLQALRREPEPPSLYGEGIPPALDAVVKRGLARDPSIRFATAAEMAAALEGAIGPSSQREVGLWVADVAGEILQARAEVLCRIETESPILMPPVPSAESLRTGPPPLPRASSRPQARLAHPQASARGASAAPGTFTAQVWVDGAPAPPPSRRFDLRPLAFAVVIGAVVLAWVGGSMYGRKGGASVDAANASGTATATDPVAFPPPPVPPTEVAPAASASPPGSESSSSASARDARPARPPAAHPAKPSCNPPYTKDKKGIRVPKPECL
jgi:eukaryotic-like serine/threonine-protein kinase